MKIGILGGGQLGRMFLQVASNGPDEIYILDPDPAAPAAALTPHFHRGDFNDYDTVLAFGRPLDAIGIEIEHVNVAALRQLQAEGKRIIPDPEVLAVIQDKLEQKRFYAAHALPTAPFIGCDGEALPPDAPALPCIQKTRTGGYDGRGVQLLRTAAELWPGPTLLEALCPIAQELAVLVARDEAGHQVVYPVMEMVFDPELHLVDFVQMPARLNDEDTAAAQALGERVAAAFGRPGLYAVELFRSTGGELWVNETACRVHNSAHVSIEACLSSQFEQMYRLLAGLPLGSPEQLRPAAMLNLVGLGAEALPQRALLAEAGVYLHWYAKAEARPGRKMGHLTLLAPTAAALEEKVKRIKELS